MATIPAIPLGLNPSSEDQLRVQLEELLFDFYSVVGVAPRRPYPVVAADLLTDNFQGRFFISATSELMYFMKAQMLASKVGRGEGRGWNGFRELRRVVLLWADGNGPPGNVEGRRDSARMGVEVRGRRRSRDYPRRHTEKALRHRRPAAHLDCVFSSPI